MNDFPMRLRLKPEYLVYAAAFSLALIIRMVAANQMPLTNQEAELALQSLALAQGQAPLLGPHPLYLALTSLWMAIFSATEWAARFWPALAGSFLVLIPALFRDRIGKGPAVLLAVFLAIDPGMLAISRQAGSQSMALFFSLLALGLWLKQRPSLAGLSAGLALLSGPTIWPGLISLFVALWLSGGFREAPAAQVQSETKLVHTPVRKFVFSTLLTLFFAGTLFFFIPDGLSAAGQSLPAYLSGWFPISGASAGMPIGLFLLGLLLYEFFPLMFGLWNGIRSLRRSDLVNPGANRLTHFLVIWWLAAFLLALIYPGRQLSDLAWSLIPLWVLAARQIIHLITLPEYDRLPVIGQAILASIIIGFISMGVVTMTNAPSTDPLQSQVQLAGALVMLFASGGLIAWGWSRRVAMKGISWGLGILLLLYFIASGWNAAGLAGRERVELWSSGSRVNDANLILSTLKNLDQWGLQQAGGPTVAVVGVSSPALRWLLRNVEQVSYETALSNASSPAIVITPLQPQLSLASTYRGEAFVLGETLSWQLLKPADWFRWQVFRIAPDTAVQQDKIILWARTDLFPGGSVQTNPASQLPPK